MKLYCLLISYKPQQSANRWPCNNIATAVFAEISFSLCQISGHHLLLIAIICSPRDGIAITVFIEPPPCHWTMVLSLQRVQWYLLQMRCFCWREVWHHQCWLWYMIWHASWHLSCLPPCNSTVQFGWPPRRITATVSRDVGGGNWGGAWQQGGRCTSSCMSIIDHRNVVITAQWWSDINTWVLVSIAKGVTKTHLFVTKITNERQVS